MAATKPKSADNKAEKKGLTENQRWVYGFILLFFALFVLLSVVSYYFCWADDQSTVRWGDMWNRDGGPVLNLGGRMGAVLAEVLVGHGFGAFGVVIPAVLIVLAIRIMGLRPMFLRRSVRVSLIVMILGSVSLGLVFGTSWEIFGTGLGGVQGILVARWLSSYIGFLGMALMLLLSWVLLAVYLNRSTIHRVNKLGKNIADTGAAVGKGAASLIRKGEGQTAAEEVQREGDDSSGEEFDTMIDRGPRPSSGGGTLQDVKPQADAGASEGAATAIQTGSMLGAAAGITAKPVPIMPVTTINDTFSIIQPGDEELPESGGISVFGESSAGEQGASSAEGFVIAPWDDQPGAEGQQQVPGPQRRQAGDGADGGGFEIIETSGRIEAGSVINEQDQLLAAERERLLEEEDILSTLYDPTLELSKYQRPPVEILEDHSVEVVVTEEEVRENQNQIKRTLENFGIKIDKTKATVGPTVTLYEIVPAPGIRISKIKNLEDDIALSLSALGIRIIAPMPGKGTIGIEVPNKDKKIVSMYSVVRSPKFQESTCDLPVVLGKTIQNETYVIDLAKMPHLLVAGATGQGKSVGLNAILASLLYKKHPAELKFVLVDPKKVELTLYQKLEKHFLARMEGEDESIITDTHKVINTLNSLCKEMDSRYDLLRKAEVRNIKEYNDKFTRRRLNPQNGHRFLPYIVVVIDEFADMIMTAGREIETPIARLAQLARAIGIHLVIATQRPTTNIITGVIKANFPARIAFRVSSMVDSRTIIDQPGANQLIGRGDMLVYTGSDMVRVQCAFLDTPELERVMDFISRQKGFAEPYPLPEFSSESDGPGKVVDLEQTDPMFDEVARFVVQNQQGSTSAIQRRFSIGYNRAGRIMDQIEAAGIVGKPEGGKPREVLITDMVSLETLLTNMML